MIDRLGTGYSRDTETNKFQLISALVSGRLDLSRRLTGSILKTLDGHVSFSQGGRTVNIERQPSPSVGVRMWRKISTLLALVCSVVEVMFTDMANAQSVHKLETMTQEISELRSQWKYADAIVLAKRAVAETEGKSGLWLSTLADLQSDAGSTSKRRAITSWLSASTQTRRLAMSRCWPTLSKALRTNTGSKAACGKLNKSLST
jgi:hypothetical protein